METARGKTSADSGRVDYWVCCGFAVAAVFAETAYFGARDGDFDVEIIGNLRLQILVELRFEFPHPAAADARHVNVIARAVAFVIVAMAAQVKQVEFVDQAVVFQQVHGAIDRDARDVGIDFLRAIENFFGVHVAGRTFEHFYEHHALAREANAARLDFALQMAEWLVFVDTFTDGRTTRKRCF
jgi:hypothetical protein